MKKFFIYVLAAGLFLTGCSGSSNKANYDLHLYEVSDKNGHKDYLFGSTHIGLQKVYTITPALEEAFRNSKVLVLESNPMEVELKMTYDSTYATDYSADECASDEMLKVFNEDEYGIRFDTSAYNALTIYALALLQFGHEVPFVALGGTGVTGIDRFLAKEAMNYGMPIEEIEGADKQFNMIKEISKEAPNYFLEQTLNRNKIKENAGLIFEAYQSADNETLHRLLADYTSSQYSEEADLAKQYLLTDRNQLFFQSVISHLTNEQTELVAIGAVHLYGEAGLISQLESAGYSVRCLGER